MGTRGRLPGSNYGPRGGRKADPERQARLGNPSHGGKKPAKRASTNVVPINQGTVPAPPSELGPLGAEIWSSLHRAMPLLNETLDRHSVLRYAQAAEDAVRARVDLEQHGLTLEEVIVSPKGDVVGTRRVINPAEGALRRADAVLDRLGDRLGMSPAARARLGLTISKAEVAQAQAEHIASTMFRPVIDV